MNGYEVTREFLISIDTLRELSGQVSSMRIGHTVVEMEVTRDRPSGGGFWIGAEMISPTPSASVLWFRTIQPVRVSFFRFSKNRLD